MKNQKSNIDAFGRNALVDKQKLTIKGGFIDPPKPKPKEPIPGQSISAPPRPEPQP